LPDLKGGGKYGGGGKGGGGSSGGGKKWKPRGGMKRIKGRSWARTKGEKEDTRATSQFYTGNGRGM